MIRDKIIKNKFVQNGYIYRMRKIVPILSASILLLSACSQNTRVSDTTNTRNTGNTTKPAVEKAFFARMRINEKIKAGDPVNLKFTVYNHTDGIKQFCKWHTPFEPLMSKYLDVKEEGGAEVGYQGPMAKRIMPPPADSYLKLNPGDSLSIDIDLLKAYPIKKAGKYSIVYTGQNMSGLVVKDRIEFEYGK